MEDRNSAVAVAFFNPKSAFRIPQSLEVHEGNDPMCLRREAAAENPGFLHRIITLALALAQTRIFRSRSAVWLTSEHHDPERLVWCGRAMRPPAKRRHGRSGNYADWENAESIFEEWPR